MWLVDAEHDDLYRQPVNRYGHLMSFCVRGGPMKAREFFRKMEEGDESALSLWRELREVSVTEFQKMYERLGIHFEHYEGESRYQGKTARSVRVPV